MLGAVRSHIFKNGLRVGITKSSNSQNTITSRGKEIYWFVRTSCLQDILPYRSSASAHRGVAEIIQRKVQSVGLISHWFYHLDTCFCPLSATEAIYYPAAFYSDALGILKEYIDTLIPVTEDEARRFACNAIVIGKNVIINHGCPQICRRLESLEFSVFETPLTEFIKAGGSAKCLVLKIPHLDNAPLSSQNRLPAA